MENGSHVGRDLNKPPVLDELIQTLVANVVNQTAGAEFGS